MLRKVLATELRDAYLGVGEPWQEATLCLEKHLVPVCPLDTAIPNTALLS